MKTAQRTERAAQGGAAAPRRDVSPQTRTRCSRARMKEEEMRKQVKRAMPEIVSASIEKAKSGSLVHTKWLWGIADAAETDAKAQQPSLAQMLADELAERSEPGRE